MEVTAMRNQKSVPVKNVVSEHREVKQSGFSKANQNFLINTFGSRVRFDKREMKMYSHDIASIPSLVNPIVGNTIPRAVVQPVSEKEIVKLVNWAAKEKVHLTPRAKSTSGYGGVIPVKRDVVIDFHRLQNILKIDKENHLVTVQPGIVWEKLDHELNKKGLRVNSYPTSYPSSTVGGWFAQAGAGIGSYSAGWFRDCVTKVRMVLANGVVRELDGEDLDLAYGAEGITGLITEITVKVLDDDELKVMSIGCQDAKSLNQIIESIHQKKLPIWNMMLINPSMAELKNKAPEHEHDNKPEEERVVLPDTYMLTLNYAINEASFIEETVKTLVQTNGLKILSQKIANREWENRFRFMVVKRLGPSLVPAEVVVPLENLSSFLEEVDQKILQYMVEEGIVISEGRDGKPEVVILGFIPSDERKLKYNFVFGLVLSIIKIAKKYGGRSYATGMYFTNKAKEILGESPYKRMLEFKRETDPQDILNPGKVLKGGMLGTLMSVASAFEPIIRPIGNRMHTDIGERTIPNNKGIPADIAWYAYACSQCGYCVDECDQFYGRGWESQSPRGKWYWLREFLKGKEKWDQEVIDTFLVCTTCELCNVRCSESLPIESSWMKLRGKLIQDDERMTIPPFYMMSASLNDNGNIWAGYKKNRDAWFPEYLKEKHGSGIRSENVYFAGCTASYVENDIGKASVELLDKAGVDFTYLGNNEQCCGTPMLVAGKWDQFAEILKHNYQEVKKVGGNTVITSCPACDMMWRKVYPEWAKKLNLDWDIKVKHYSEITSEQIKDGKFKFPENNNGKQTVTWHDSCHIGRVSHVYEEPRNLIKAIPGVKLVDLEHNREEAHCCGSVLTLMKDPTVAANIGEMRLNEARATGASKLLALCPCCEFQFRVTADKMGIDDLEIVDLAHFAMGAFGVTYKDPNPEVLKQWATFEAMIELMTPQGFAEIMKSMWPELIEAMPYGMGKMMRGMGKIPGALNLMKPMFPILMPRMLPAMLPKVMDTMLQRISERVPMPDYMAEQMPDMMPKVMHNLMPYMVKDVVPLVTDPMIEYLHGKKN